MRLLLFTNARALLAMLPLISIAPKCHAETAPTVAIAVRDFTGVGGQAFTMSGDAALDGPRIRLTRADGALAGSAMYSDAVELAKDGSFSTYFTFSMSPIGDPGARYADGIAFVLHSDKKNLGTIGEGVGYRGIEPSFVVEFDTFQNGEHGDPSFDHIGINVNGDMKSLSTAAAPIPFADGASRHVWIEYDGSAKTVEVRVATTADRPKKPTLSQSFDLTGLLTASPHVGFTAGTGKYSEEHHIESFYFAGHYLPNGIKPGEE